MLTDQWKKEEDYEKEVKRQEFVLNRERNQDLIRHNQAEQIIRDAQTDIEKTRDRRLLNNALDRENMLMNIEKAEKDERKKEVV